MIKSGPRLRFPPVYNPLLCRCDGAMDMDSWDRRGPNEVASGTWASDAFCMRWLGLTKHARSEPPFVDEQFGTSTRLHEATKCDEASLSVIWKVPPDDLVIMPVTPKLSPFCPSKVKSYRVCLN